MSDWSSDVCSSDLLDAANISANLVRQMEQGFYVGPILMGAAKSAHIVSRHVTVRGLVNMSAVAVVDAQDHADGVLGPRVRARSDERRVGKECVSKGGSRWET